MFRNPFATLGADKKARLGSQQQQQQQQPRKKPAASAEPEQTEEELAAAAERKREKNRLKRAKKKAKAGGANGAANAENKEGSDEEDSDDDETTTAAAPRVSTTPQSADAARRARPSPLAVAQDAKQTAAAGLKSDRVPTPVVANGNGAAARAAHQKAQENLAAKTNAVEEESEEEESEEEESEEEEEPVAAPAAAAIASDSSEEEDEEDEEEESSGDEEETEAAAEEDDDEEEDEEDEESESEEEEEEEEEEESGDEDDEDVDAQVISLGHDPSVVAAVRAQLESEGIPVNTETLLLYVQQDELMAEERRTGKLTVFKPKYPQKPTRPPITKQNATAAAVPAKTPAVAVAPVPATAAAKKGAAAPAAAPAAKPAPVAAASKATPAPAKGARGARAGAADASAAAPVAAASTAPVAAPAALPARDDHTVAGLERSAAAWNPITEPAAALMLIDEWNALLERANTAQKSGGGFAVAATPDASALEFSRAFHQSSALENLVRQCLTTVWVSAAEGSKNARAIDAPLLRLFTLTIPGRKPVDHQFLLSALRALGKTLEKTSSGNSGSGNGASARSSLLNQVIAVVTEARKIGAVHREMDGVLSDESRAASGVAAPTPAAVQAQALAELNKQAVNPELFFGAGAASASAASSSAESGIKSMWLAAATHSASLAQGDALLDRFSVLLNSLPRRSLQLQFHQLENAIQRSQAATTEMLSRHSSQSSIVDKQRETLEGNLTRELAPLKLQSKEQASRESELLKRKSELLNELDKVNASLEIVARAKSTTAKSMASIEETYNRNRQSLQEINAETIGRAAALQQDQTAAHAIHALIVGTYERLSASTDAQLQRLMSANAQRLTRHLQTVGHYLTQQHALMEFLQKRLSFCTTRLSSLRADHEAAAALGVSLASGAMQAETERSLSAMTKQDQKVMLHARAGANALVKHVSRAAEGAKSVPIAQLAQLYTQLLNTLESRKVTTSFELQPLRDCVHKLAAAAQRALEEATNGGGVNAPQNGAAPVAAATAVATQAAPSDLAEADAFSQAAKQPRKALGDRVRERKQQQAAQGSSPSASASPPAAANGSASPAPAAATAAASAPANGRNGAKKGPQAQAQANGNGNSNGRASGGKAQQQQQPNGSGARAPAAAPAAAVSPQPAVAQKPKSAVAAPPSKSWATSVSPLPPAAVTNDSSTGVESAFPALSSANLQKATAAEKMAAKKMQQLGSSGNLAATAAAAAEPAAATPSPTPAAAAEAPAPVTAEPAADAAPVNSADAAPVEA